MIRHQDLVREVKELVRQLQTQKGDESSSKNIANRILLSQQCQTTIQHHEAWLSTIITPVSTKKSDDISNTPGEDTLQDALQQVHLQLLLQQGGDANVYAQVLKATSDASSSTPMSTTILRAYALYQLQEYDQVLDLLDNIPSEHPEESMHPSALAALHLQAQSYYHLQDYEGAMEVYATVLEQLEDACANGDDDDVHEVYVNYMASYLNQYSLPYCPESKNNKVTKEEDETLTDLLAVVEKQHQPKSEDETMLDLRYNVATYQLLHRSNAREAKLFLQSRRAQDNNCHNQYEWSQHFWQPNTGMKGMRFQTKDTATSKNISNTKDPWLLLQYYHDKYETLNDLPQDTNSKIKWTLFQKRLLDYNRCVALLHQKQYDECRLVVRELWETMAPEKPPEKDDPTVNDPILLWWEVRLAVLLLYCPEVSSGNSSNTKNRKKTTATGLELRSVRALEFALMSIAESPFRDHTLVYLQLHQAAAEEQFKQQPSLDELYADWPPSLRTKPAVQATMIALQQSQASEQPNGKSPTKETALMQGHWHFIQGDYRAAAECYETALSDAKDSEVKQMIQARLVRALTHVDPDKAMKLWDDMSSHLKTTDDNDSDYDVQAMEGLEKSSQRWNHANKTVTHEAGAMESATTAVNMETPTDTTKKSRDSVFKQRARRRAQYLDQLQKKGIYNPERPTQPDPERWIPKYDRAANRRRKKNHAPAQNKHQGTGTISEKDLAKLDVAARQQQPKNLVSNTASTAHISAAGARKGGKRR